MVRDAYLQAATGAERLAALRLLVDVVASIRDESTHAASDMTKLLTAAMASETANKKIAAMKEIAETKANRLRNASNPTLADLIAETEAHDDAPTDPSAAAGGDAEA